MDADFSLAPEAPSLRHIAFEVAYDGTDWCGSQRQTNGRSVQGELESALQTVFKTPTTVLLAGRTDAGVHATGQAGRFETSHTIAAERVPLALNRVLDRSIRVVRAWEVGERWHPRYSATSRVYRYWIDNAPIHNPLTARVAGQVRDALDVEAMRAVCGEFVGERDFAAWQSAGSPPSGGTVRIVRELKVARREDCFGSDLIEIEIEANGFLYQMVRNIVGALMEAGRGKLDAQRIAQLFAERDRTKCPPPAPPQGLCLVRVKY
jgi:tRNA pseudouridine38-40 synthase